MGPIIMDGKALAAKVKREVRAEAEGLPRRPGLAVIIVGDAPASRVYVNSKRKDCEDCGFLSEEYALPAGTKQEELIALIEKLNGREEIDGILCCLIRREKALEVNTSCLGTGYDALLPEPWVLARYRTLGGRLLTLGSDAHTPERLAYGFPETARLLRELGFRDYVHYEGRQPQFHPLV